MVKVKKAVLKRPKKPAKGFNKVQSLTEKKTHKKQEAEYSSMSVEDFFDQDFESNEEDEQESEEEEEEQESEEEEEVASLNDDEDEVKAHKESLAKLKETDPEFYKFLQDNDKKLLNFDVEDEQEVDEERDNDVHIPNEELEVASDESDYEADDTVSDGHKMVTLKLLKKWQTEIQTDKSKQTMSRLVEAFHAALQRVSNCEDEVPSKFKVEGSAVFNAVIQLCVLELGPAVKRFLGLTAKSKQPPHKCKRFVKIKGLLKVYFTDLLKLLSGVTSSNIITVLLKHLHYMSSLLVSFPHVTKPLLRRLVHLWSTSDENVRVVAFLCILRITGNHKAGLLSPVLKMMYMAYVKNSKFVSLGTLPGINFMRRSVVEMFAMDTTIAYQHVFLYIRQLAIHLRNAVTLKKKENVQAVCNWQFVNSLRLWGNLLMVTCNKQQLQALIYPFVQVCLGTMKLVPTAQYFPLRFHVVQILMDLSRDTGIFIPILPFLLEVLSIYDFNRKHQKVSMKPLQFTCILRLSKSQMSENGFKDTTIDTVYAQILEYLASMSHTMAFPDLSLFATVQLKQFVKNCSVANYNRRMKQLLEKITQNSQFIENERSKVTLSLAELKKIEGWESQMKNKGTPLNAFFESWNKMRTVKKNKEATNNEAIGDYDLPVLKKVKREKKVEKGPLELFPSDSESDTEKNDFDEEKGAGKRKRGKRGGKNVNKRVVVDYSGKVEVDSKDKDIVEDLNISDW